LPSTGGMGTTLFYVVGGLMVAGAAIALIAKNRVAKMEA
ncbi:MAG: LPXTG cell wall anchor domain-containing protein, partial [Atopobiaceae bacterium]|nr:LPXTG cell wall anchor domain-containing protein [Atopobiaceae bacterium]